MKYRLETEIGDIATIYEVGAGNNQGEVAKVDGVELAEKIVRLLNTAHDVEQAMKEKIYVAYDPANTPDPKLRASLQLFLETARGLSAIR